MDGLSIIRHDFGSHHESAVGVYIDQLEYTFERTPARRRSSLAPGEPSKRRPAHDLSVGRYSEFEVPLRWQNEPFRRVPDRSRAVGVCILH